MRPSGRRRRRSAAPSAAPSRARWTAASCSTSRSGSRGGSGGGRARGHDRRRHAGPRARARRELVFQEHKVRRRRPLPRHAQHRRRERLGGARGRGDGARRVRRRARRLSVRAELHRQRGDRGRALPAGAGGRRDRRRPRRRDRDARTGSRACSAASCPAGSRGPAASESRRGHAVAASNASASET